MTQDKKYTVIDKIAFFMIRWIGTPVSILIHTALFLGAFALILFGVDTDRVLLVLTTIVSLEAIYLSLFIQMTMNLHAKKIRKVQSHIEDIAEDVEDLAEDIEDLSNEDETTHNNKTT